MTVPSALTIARAFSSAADFASSRGEDAEAARCSALADALLLWRAWPAVVSAVGRADPKLATILVGLAPTLAKDPFVVLVVPNGNERRLLAPGKRRDLIIAALRCSTGWDIKLKVTS